MTSCEQRSSWIQHSDDDDDDDDDFSALLDKWRLSARVWEPWCTALITVGFIIHTRRVRADLTAICLFDHVAPQPGSRPEASIVDGGGKSVCLVCPSSWTEQTS